MSELMQKSDRNKKKVKEELGKEQKVVLKEFLFTSALLIISFPLSRNVE